MDRYTLVDLLEQINAVICQNILLKNKFLKPIETCRLKIYEICGTHDFKNFDIDENAFERYYDNSDYYDCEFNGNNIAKRIEGIIYNFVLDRQVINFYGNRYCEIMYNHNASVIRDDNPDDYENLTPCSILTSIGSLECLKYLYENDCKWDKWTCSVAAAYGFIDCLKYAHEHGCYWDENTCYNAALFGNLECLKYACENKCPITRHCMKFAVKGGNLNCLKYLHENNHYNQKLISVVNIAAERGHLDCLKYLHENGYPWNKKTTFVAFKNKQYDCFKYAIENGCDIDYKVCIMCLMNKDNKLFEIIYNKLYDSNTEQKMR